MRNRIMVAVGLALTGLALMASAVSAQDAGTIVEPTIGQLGSAVGLSGVILIILSIGRSWIDPFTFDKFAPLAAVVIGIIGAEAYVLVTGEVTGTALLQAGLIGLFAGSLSQNFNTVVRRAVTP